MVRGARRSIAPQLYGAADGGLPLPLGSSVACRAPLPPPVHKGEGGGGGKGSRGKEGGGEKGGGGSSPERGVTPCPRTSPNMNIVSKRAKRSDFTRFDVNSWRRKLFKFPPTRTGRRYYSARTNARALSRVYDVVTSLSKNTLHD